jgi:hypothetical protein
MVRTTLVALAALSLLATGCGKKDADGGAEKPADPANNPFKIHRANVQGLLDVLEKAGDPDKAAIDGQNYVETNKASIVANCKIVREWQGDIKKGAGSSQYSFDYQKLHADMGKLASGDFKKSGQLIKVLEQVRNCDTVHKLNP